MTQYMTPGLSAMLHTAIKPIFWHTYTREAQLTVDDTDTTPGVDESTSAWGEQVVQYGPAQSGLPCSYMDKGSLVVGPNGPVEITIPTLLVPSNDPLDDGDRVSHVLGSDKVTVLYEGPGAVETVAPTGVGTDGMLYTQVTLRQITEVLQ